jgi:hypothetical protein
MTPDPKGGAQGCAPFFDQAKDGLSKNPRARPDESGGVSRQALSLVTFFGPAKKVTRRKAEALAWRSKKEQPQRH